MIYTQANIPSYPSWLNSTAVDDVFEFGEEYNVRRSPVFLRLPGLYNMVLNDTGGTSGSSPDSIYVLARTNSTDPPYMLCSLKASISVNCSTRFHASMSGGYLESHCEDPDDTAAYIRSKPNAPDGRVQADWSRVASEWAKSVAFNDGPRDANASSARLLTQLVPKNMSLDPSMPSIA